MFSLLKKVFPSHNDKIVKKYRGVVSRINDLSSEFSELSHTEILEKTATLQKKYEILGNEEVLPEAFALVREGASRILNMRHYDVQLIGGMALNDGCIAEMKTGEGKTLASTLPAYLNALSGKGVHIVTANEYLSQRDFDWMSRVHRYLGLTVGFSGSKMTNTDKKDAYNCDICYATNTELGFDYLRDNTRFYREDMTILSRPFNYAIIDEVDSILIDEARTPLIISGPGKGSSDLYTIIDKIVQKLTSEHYEIEEKHKNIQLTDVGNEKIEELLKKSNLIDKDASLYDANAFELINHVVQSLRARKMFTKDKDYILRNNEVLLVDEFTGRIMDGRRYSGGLHQAIEAKENVVIQKENQTIASITYQNFFKLYDKLSGMTGTAQTEASEFLDIYNLSVVSVPTYLPIARKDHDDLIFKTEAEKLDFLTNLIVEKHARGQPILVGTTNIAKSEAISDILIKKQIKHKVLNAKNHALEAEIIASAGCKNAVTIATNMAGRGTDIILGGNLDAKILLAIKDIEDSDEIKNITEKIRHSHNGEKEEVIAVGGLFVIGSERHESRRIDNQLRGRAGRLGDAGESQFFLALDDDLLRIFGGDKIGSVLSKLGLKDNEPMNHHMLNSAIVRSQQKLENMHYEMRKNVLKYDTIMNEQREIVYRERLKFIEANTLKEEAYSVLTRVIIEIENESTTNDGVFEKQNFEKSLTDLIGHKGWNYLGFDFTKEYNKDDIITEIVDKCIKYNEDRFSLNSVDLVEKVEKYVMITAIDDVWRDHLYYLGHIKEAIHLRAYAQKDPLIEYKMESFNAFETMFKNFRYIVAKKLMHIEIRNPEDADLSHILEPITANKTDVVMNDYSNFAKVNNVKSVSTQKESEQLNLLKTLQSKQNNVVIQKIGRNDPCFCGSGKKFKSCCSK